MDYLEWVQKVMNTILGAWNTGKSREVHLGGLWRDEVTVSMGFVAEDAQGRATNADRAVEKAIRDLVDLGMLERARGGGSFKVTQFGLQVMAAGLPALWGPIIDKFLTPEQLEVLAKLVEVTRQDGDDYATLKGCTLADLASALGGEWEDKVEPMVRALAGIGLVRMGGSVGSSDNVPTYRGIVRVTRQDDVEGQQLIRALLVEWETVNVDFKQQIDLDTKPGKAEFVKDILGLINTKVTGKRYMIIGFDDDEPHEFVQSVDSTVTKDRMEDILNAYTEPVPTI